MASAPQSFRLQRSKGVSARKTVHQQSSADSASLELSNGSCEDQDFMVNGVTDSGSDGYTCTTFSSFSHVTVNGSQSAQSTDSDSNLGIKHSSKKVTFQENGSKAETSLDHMCASFNDKIQYLAQQRKVLQERWSLLQNTDISSQSSQSDLDALYQSYINQLLKQVNTIYHDNGQIQSDLLDFMGSVHDIKDQYEDEISTHTQLEYDFVQLKKDFDNCSLEKTELETKRKELHETIELMRAVYEQELEELMSEIKDISVIVEMDSGCPVNLEAIVQEVRDQYAFLALKSKEEAEALSRNTLDDRAAKARKCGSDLLSSRDDITELNVKIQKMRSEILTLRDQSMHLESTVTEAMKSGESAVEDARSKLVEVEVALKKAREDMALQLREFKALMNIKLSLDMEIATYKKLLEGEESRVQMPPATVVSIQSRSSFKGRASEWAGSSKPPQKQQMTKRSQSMLIKPQYK